jgi:hypothetical protein
VVTTILLVVTAIVCLTATLAVLIDDSGRSANWLLPAVPPLMLVALGMAAFVPSESRDERFLGSSIVIVVDEWTGQIEGDPAVAALFGEEQEDLLPATAMPEPHRSQTPLGGIEAELRIDTVRGTEGPLGARAYLVRINHEPRESTSDDDIDLAAGRSWAVPVLKQAFPEFELVAVSRVRVEGIGTRAAEAVIRLPPP